MKYQFMPMFWGDFFANTLHLTAQEAGAYLFLIGHAWENDANIAVTDLRRVARVGNNRWYKVRPRLEQFFTPMKGVQGGPLGGGDYWHHSRVYQELTKANEISDKRRGAAMQMHSKSRANGHANNGHLHLQLPIEMLSDVREASDPTEKPTPAEPKPVAEKKNPRDPSLDYRSPPKTKSDNVLEPIPERPAFRRP